MAAKKMISFSGAITAIVTVLTSVVILTGFYNMSISATEKFVLAQNEYYLAQQKADHRENEKAILAILEEIKTQNGRIEKITAKIHNHDLEIDRLKNKK